MPKTTKKDVCYILKKNIDTQELIYSLRSVEKNLPHRKVWFVGGQPEGLTPDGRLIHEQVGDCKWEMIRSSMRAILDCPDITDEFYLFNDDFFVMKPVKGKFINFADKTLTYRICELKIGQMRETPYTKTLIKVREELKILGYDETNFEVHLPMLIDKKLMRNSINACSSPQMRSAYGNINKIKYIEKEDVKVYDLNAVPKDADFISTNDRTFTNGKVGRFIRETFTEPSRFEKI